MPADPITPSRAAAWDNTAPDVVGVPSRFACAVRGQSNLASLIQITGTIDGVSLTGTLATAVARALLLTAQTNQSQNGIYTTAAYGSNLTLPATFSGGGIATKTGLTVGRLYLWTKVNGTNITNGTTTLTESGFITPNVSGNLTLNGGDGDPVNDTLRECQWSRYSLFDNPNEFPTDLIVRVDGGTSINTWWRLTSTNIFNVGTNAITFAQVTTGQLDVGYDDDPWDNTAPTSITPSRAAAFDDTAPAGKNPVNATAWDNTAPGGKTPANAAAWDNTSPAGKTPVNATAWDNTGPTAATNPRATAFDDTAPAATTNPRGTAWSNGSPETIILVGTQSPVAGVTIPASPTVATDVTTLVAGQNYLVQVGSRANPVTITLPDPGSLAQRIEIADIANLAAVYPITVNGGTKDIESTGVKTYVVNRAGAVLTLSYTGTYWKIL